MLRITCGDELEDLDESADEYLQKKSNAHLLMFINYTVNAIFRCFFFLFS